MNVQVRDTPPAETLGKRLRVARETARYTRPQLAKLTGIPSKSIEKFEADEQEPSVSRLIAMCGAFGIPIDAVLHGSDPAPASSPSPSTPGQSDTDPVEDDLNEIDELRETGFRNCQRRALALVSSAISAMHFLEPDDLVTLALERGVDAATCPTALDLHNALAADATKGQEACAGLEERIVDTVFLGTDLFAVPRETLLATVDRLSAQFDLSPKGWSWGDHDELVPALRTPLRQLAATGKAVTLAGDQGPKGGSVGAAPPRAPFRFTGKRS